MAAFTSSGCHKLPKASLTPSKITASSFLFFLNQVLLAGWASLQAPPTSLLVLARAVTHHPSQPREVRAETRSREEGRAEGREEERQLDRKGREGLDSESWPKKSDLACGGPPAARPTPSSPAGPRGASNNVSLFFSFCLAGARPGRRRLARKTRGVTGIPAPPRPRQGLAGPDLLDWFTLSLVDLFGSNVKSPLDRRCSLPQNSSPPGNICNINFKSLELLDSSLVLVWQLL